MSRSNLMRLLLVTALAASLVAVQKPVSAHHLPESHCSESGDLCQSVKRVDGVRRLSIRMAARYFRRFTLCVRDPGGARVCEERTMRPRADGTYGRSIRWTDHIWHQRQPGAYTVSWWVEGERVGRRLGFHI